MTLDLAFIVELLGIAAAGGVAWGGAKQGAKAYAGEVRELKDDFKKHCDTDIKMGERLTRVETLVEAVHGKVVLKRRGGDRDEP